MTFLGQEGVKVLPPPITVSLVQDGMNLCARRSPYALHPVCQTFPQRFRCTISSVRLMKMVLSLSSF